MNVKRLQVDLHTQSWKIEKDFHQYMLSFAKIMAVVTEKIVYYRNL